MRARSVYRCVHADMCPSSASGRLHVVAVMAMYAHPSVMADSEAWSTHVAAPDDEHDDDGQVKVFVHGINGDLRHVV